MEFSGFLVPVYCPQFEIPKGQISITSDLRFVNEHVGQTIHGFDSVLHILDFCEIHLVPIIFEMAGLLPEIKPEEMRTDGNLITSFQMLFLFKILQDRPEHGPFGVIDDQTWTGFFAKAEKIELSPQLSMVSLTGFLKHMKEFSQCLLGWKCSTIDSLEDFIPSVSPPISPRHVQKLKCFDSPGRRDMRPFTEIQKTPLSIKRYVIWKILQVFNLIGLTHRLKCLNGLLL
jgi:hypothetical protein